MCAYTELHEHARSHPRRNECAPGTSPDRGTQHAYTCVYAHTHRLACTLMHRYTPIHARVTQTCPIHGHLAGPHMHTYVHGHKHTRTRTRTCTHRPPWQAEPRASAPCSPAAWPCRAPELSQRARVLGSSQQAKIIQAQGLASKGIPFLQRGAHGAQPSSQGGK